MGKPPEAGERTPKLDSRADGDKGLAWWLGGLLSGPVLVGIALLASAVPQVTETVYGQRIGPFLGWLLARATGWLPLSIAEWALLFLVFHWVGRWVTASRLDGMRLRALGRATLLTLREASIALAIFMLVFGIQYRRPTLPERMDWNEEISTEILAPLAAESVDEVNGLYFALHRGEDPGHPTRFGTGFGNIDVALTRAWPSVADEFRLGAAAGWSRGRTKGLLISPLLARLGLSGFYFPWTGEANRNRSVPAMRQPHVAAHEMAHQRGIAREDEASFLGWAVARRSESPLARYSAAMYAHRRLMFALIRQDPERGQELLQARLPGVQRDVDDLRAYWDRYRGRATQVSQAVNDRYLRAHAIDDGTASYGRSLQLLLQYAAENGGTLTQP